MCEQDFQDLLQIKQLNTKKEINTVLKTWYLSWKKLEVLKEILEQISII
jgi:hypothetical protein